MELRIVLWLLFNATFIRMPRLISLALLFPMRGSKTGGLSWDVVIQVGLLIFLRVSFMKGVCCQEIIYIWSVWFVFSQFLQDQLDSILKQWNSHHIRRSQNHTISGVPNQMYHLPENFGYEHQGCSYHFFSNKKIFMKRQIMSLRYMKISKITFGML